MQIQLLNGKTAKLLLSKHRRKSGKSRSGFQNDVGGKLERLFPSDIILEEVVIPGERFVLDFFVPSMCLVVECQGRQHSEFVPHFHSTRQKFHGQQDRDGRKRQWCELNRLRLVEIHQGTADKEMERLLLGVA